MLATKAALLQRDGDVVTVEGHEALMFPTISAGDYFVTLRHRNHIGMMTDAPAYLSSVAPPLLKIHSRPAFGLKGWNEAGKVVGGNVRTLWAGDYNGDRKAIYQGPNNDAFTLFSRVLSDQDNTDISWQTSSAEGYLDASC